MASANKGKKKAPAKKKTTKKGTGAKKTAKSSPKKKAAPSTKKTVKQEPKKDRSPVYILSIMALLCALVLLVNKFNTGNKEQNASNNKSITHNLKQEKKTAQVPEKKNLEKKKKKEVKAVKSDKERKKAVTSRDINIYLVKFNERTENMSLVPMKRRINDHSPVKGALNELLKGPNKKERGRGLLTAMPVDLKIRKIDIQNNMAVLDFNSAIEEDANGNILLTRVDQIVYTATQFKEIDRVLIKINGKPKRFLGGDGLSISGPITRRK